MPHRSQTALGTALVATLLIASVAVVALGIPVDEAVATGRPPCRSINTQYPHETTRSYGPAVSEHATTDCTNLPGIVTHVEMDTGLYFNGRFVGDDYQTDAWWEPNLAITTQDGFCASGYWSADSYHEIIYYGAPYYAYSGNPDWWGQYVACP